VTRNVSIHLIEGTDVIDERRESRRRAWSQPSTVFSIVACVGAAAAAFAWRRADVSCASIGALAAVAVANVASVARAVRGR